MKEKSDYDNTRFLYTFSNVVRNPSKPPGLFADTILGDPSHPGLYYEPACSPHIFKAILGEESDNGRRTKGGLMREPSYNFLARFKNREVNGVEFEEIVGVDLIPTRFFRGKSGPVPAKEARKEGFDLVWEPDYLGFRVRQVELGMTQRDLEFLLDEVRRAPMKKRTFNTTTGHTVNKVDDLTLRVKNRAPYTEPIA